jgi:hypothetical protein
MRLSNGLTRRQVRREVRKSRLAAEAAEAAIAGVHGYSPAVTDEPGARDAACREATKVLLGTVSVLLDGRVLRTNQGYPHARTLYLKPAAMCCGGFEGFVMQLHHNYLAWALGAFSRVRPTPDLQLS